MSAIAGVYNLSHQPVLMEHIDNLMYKLKVYPANDTQIFHNEHVALGCHAQWITPESVGEQLPYYDRERQLVITADAIIDNRNELFERLNIGHYQRKIIPDSQLILLAYDKWGEDSPKYLVGDFAFMLWDEKKQKLFGARDFSGSRTLYYFQNYHHFAFCTTIEPLFSLPFVEKKLNEQWLAEFLGIAGMIDTVDASITPYQTVEQLPPSHSISIVGQKVTLKRYCTLQVMPQLKLKRNEEYIEAFQEIFQQAVHSRLRTHRQVGAQLSGGLDSGSIVGFAAPLLKKENKLLHTFSYIPPSDFNDFTPKHLMPDERPFIKATVQHVGGIKDQYLNFDGRDPYTEMNDFLDIMEMPYKFFENSFWLKGMFEKAQEEDVGLLLNGGRGNLTISWGSAIDYYAALLKKLKWLRLFQELNQYSQKAGGARFRRLPTISKVAFPFIQQISSSRTAYTNPMLINPGFADEIGVFNKLKQNGMDESGWFSTTNIYEQRKRHFEDDFHWNASNTLATKLSLRYSVWKRDPTNDMRVVQFCLSLPEEQYVQNGLDRALIRRATVNILPDKVRLNQQIRGVQGADWVHRMIPVWKNFVAEIKQMLNDDTTMGYINGEVIRNALQKIQNGVGPDYILDPDSKVLMRSLIVHKFLKKFT
ncbi:lasso peptide isopeptide bond-forming cyclase [Alkalihalobacterium alkalinitrilicum]|uniref:lasso peptide isopeptide bond-forming cyclase n=1 Tax=Alkalihalobacterium alkalinitrilicum TaxID=427920 RepID=UPI000994E2D5|nr:lasso peptide isopeptide bond-forming cyclase [Alkalihalobacterium alkalinitrilicum]